MKDLTGTPTPQGLAGHKRARDNSSEEPSSCLDEPISKRPRQDDDNDSFSSEGSDFWREVDLRLERSQNAPELSQLTWNTEDHESPLDRLVHERYQGGKGVSSSEEYSENEGVELSDNDSDSLGDEQLSDSFSSSEEDSEQSVD
ncbi:hypothetical protein N7447_000417 [Penicillium robsamsonii]|uniref:uncharacterized protein n=1 Tax=Penicillium robsamsonii TaxID=1792511 RepID=UPI0025473CC2|nr:uncharacterized protein N7447_000417 [Penicillium robsamsonii]KAJ5834391.1 hypothetical protein N7447_000417 [Penicillium robsamsonii]